MTENETPETVNLVYIPDGEEKDKLVTLIRYSKEDEIKLLKGFIDSRERYIKRALEKGVTDDRILEWEKDIKVCQKKLNELEVKEYKDEFSM